MFGVEWNWYNKKRGWTRIFGSDEKYGELIHMFEEVIEYAKLIGEFPENIDNIGYYLNNRLSAIASCAWHRYTTGEVDIGFCFNTEAANQIPLDKLREVVIHEVGHACAIGDHHGYKWKHICRRIGKKWGMEYHNFCPTEQDAAINAIMREQRLSRARYIIKCPGCGATWHRTKSCALTQHPWTYRCDCGWKGLEVTTL